MKINKLLNDGKVQISVELFPPKEWTGLDDTKRVVEEMAKFKPSFMSVTYGAGGGTSDYTVAIAKKVASEGIPALAHLTCLSSDQAKVKTVVHSLKAQGIENILALRGDAAAGSVPSSDYKHASDLIQELKTMGDFCIGAACYPEGHPESASIEKDIETLKIKVESGADFLTSQMFFDNNIFYSFLYRMLKKGVDVPVIAGIMPVTNARQINRITSLSCTQLPPMFRSIVERFGDSDEAMKQAGIVYATQQIIDLIANGVNNIHLYSMNKPEIAGQIITNLSSIYHE